MSKDKKLQSTGSNRSRPTTRVVHINVGPECHRQSQVRVSEAPDQEVQREVNFSFRKLFCITPQIMRLSETWLA